MLSVKPAFLAGAIRRVANDHDARPTFYGLLKAMMQVMRLVHTTDMLAVMVVAKRLLTGLSICESI